MRERKVIFGCTGVFLVWAFSESLAQTSGTCSVDKEETPLETCSTPGVSCTVLLAGGTESSGTCSTIDVGGGTACSCEPVPAFMTTTEISSTTYSQSSGGAGDDIAAGGGAGEGGGGGVIPPPPPGGSVAVEFVIDPELAIPLVEVIVDRLMLVCPPPQIPRPRIRVGVVSGVATVLGSRRVRPEEHIVDLQITESSYIAESVCIPCLGETGQNFMAIRQATGTLDLNTGAVLLRGQSMINNDIFPAAMPVTTSFVADGTYDVATGVLRLFSVGLDFLPFLPRPPVECEALFVRSDCNGDGDTDIGDPVFTLNFLFRDGRAPPCEVACDGNGDGGPDISDAVFELAHQFLGGPPPPPPFPECGPRGPEDVLTCAQLPRNCA